MSNTESGTSKWVLSNSNYQRMKNAVQLIFPAIGALYFGLSKYMELPSAEQVVGTMAVLAISGGIILRVSYKRYTSSDAAYDGKLVVSSSEDGRKIFSLELGTLPEDMENMEKITFKVDR